MAPGLLATVSPICPRCGGSLQDDTRGLACSACGQRFGFLGSIPLLFWPNEWDGHSDVTEIVRAFYEETPFPDYDGTDSIATLRDRALRGVFARLLDEALEPGSTVLEAGCGTGQLTNFLASSGGRRHIGADICLPSLELAEGFRSSNGLVDAQFVQMNLFRPAFPPKTFDAVVSNGVLHSTSDPFLGFQTLVSLVRPGGLVVIGLYNKLGRSVMRLRSGVLRLTGGRGMGLDARLRDGGLDTPKRKAWYMDQYRHPHESTHTMGEVIEWFERVGVDFVRSLPSTIPFRSLRDDDDLLEPEPPGSALDRALAQLAMVPRGGREGGLFVMIGRRRAR